MKTWVSRRVAVWKARLGGATGCPGRDEGRDVAFRSFALQNLRWSKVHREGGEGRAGRMLGPDWHNWGEDPHSFLSLLFKLGVLRILRFLPCAAVGTWRRGSSGVETPSRREKNGTELAGSPAGP